MVDGYFSINLPVDTVVTLSTLTGQQKGSFGNIPPSKQFPVPYDDSFDGETYIIFDFEIYYGGRAIAP